MLLLQHTVMFAYLLGSFGEILQGGTNATFKNSLRELAAKIRECSPHILAGELKQLFLITINPEQFFRIIQEDTRRIHDHLQIIERYVKTCRTDELHTIYLFIRNSYETLQDTISHLKTVANISGSPPGPPPGTKPHFNRQRNPGEPQKLRDLLIQYGFISPQTLPPAIDYIFYGAGHQENRQPIIWLKSVSELSYFVDMFFGITDQKTKWKTAHDCFLNREKQKFNYHSLRGKQYNYISGKHSDNLQTIDRIRHLIK